ncbi:MAG TPA: sulfotransferase, partial [Actinoallomurus sp.]|nr:sulfotransferase [Actinoallomurus sp.]
MLDVIGVGFGRTGTLSLKSALERVGFGPCHHMVELIDNVDQISLWKRLTDGETPDWDAVYRGYRSTADWPGARFWRQITDHFPQAKVILTVRDPQRWYESAAQSIYLAVSGPAPADPLAAGMRQVVEGMVWNGEFDGRFEDMDHAIEVFNEHNEAVRREISPDRLLVFEVAQGWEPLCAFLGVPVPDEPFPRTNDRQEFADRVRQRQAEET